MAELRIAIDAMGGDEAPASVIAGLEIACQRLPASVKFNLVGDQNKITPLLADSPQLKNHIASIDHTDIAITMKDKPSFALRPKQRSSSMWQAISQVKTGHAGACVSGGNTGALMLASKFCLGALEGIDKPAISGIWPGKTGRCLVLDMGATIGADDKHLIMLTIMGATAASMLLDKPRPKVALLNIGVEEIKGNDEIKSADRILRHYDNNDFDYIGFIEGNNIASGLADVIVTEGFAGNIALKTAEGTANFIGDTLRSEISKSLIARFGYLFVRTAFKRASKTFNPNNFNGGVFLGLNGLVIKSHGGASPQGFASAVKVAYNVAHSSLIDRLHTNLNNYWLKANGSRQEVK